MLTLSRTGSNALAKPRAQEAMKYRKEQNGIPLVDLEPILGPPNHSASGPYLSGFVYLLGEIRDLEGSNLLHFFLGYDSNPFQQLLLLVPCGDQTNF